MKLERIQIRGFGHLLNQEYEFAKGLNLIVGPSDAGKSILLRAIQTFLYGPFTDAGQWAGAAAWENDRPGNGSPYGGALALTLASRDAYRIERDLQGDKTTVYREPGASDVTREYATGGHGWIDFADRHLGMSPAVFRASACVPQEALVLEGNDVRALQSRLEALTDTTGSEGNAQEALKRLAAWRAEINPDAVMIERSPLRQTEEEARALREKIGDIRDALASFGELIATEQRLRDRAAVVREELASLKGLATLARLKDLESRIAELEEVDRQLKAARQALTALGDPGQISEADIKAVELALGEVARAEKVAAEARRVVDGEKAEREAREADLNDTEQELEKLPAVTWRESELDAARYAVQVWERAETDLAQHRERVATIKHDRASIEEHRDASLVGLESEAIRQAITTFDLREDEYAHAQEEAKNGAPDPVLKAEFDDLTGRLRNLSTERIAELRSIERKINRAVNPPPFRRVLIVSLLLGIVGMGVGYFLAAAPGVLVGGLCLTILGLMVAPHLLQPDVSARELKENRSSLLSAMIGTGAQTLDELEQLWYRRQSLAEELGTSRQAREALRRAEVAFDDAESNLFRLLGVRSPKEAREILVRLETWHSEATVLDRQVEDADAAVGERENQLGLAARRAQQALEAVGLQATAAASVRARVEGLREEQRKRASLLLKQARAQTALKDFRARQDAAAKAGDVLEDALRAAREKLARLGYEGSVADARTTIAQIQEQLERSRDLRAQIDRWSAARQALVRDADPDSWSAECTRLRAELADEKVHADYSPRDVEKLVGSREAELRSIEGKLAQFETQRVERIGRVEEPAVLVEQLADAEDRYNALRRRLAAVDTARELIQKAADGHRRDFAPRLGNGIGARLAWVTTGRYSQVEIAPETLAIRLKSTERGGMVTLDQVSIGTRDAVALLLRVGIVDLLGKRGEPVPVFLDDPLVNGDPERTRSALQVLQDLSEERQIFYFTQDPRLAEWATETGPCQVIRLEQETGQDPRTASAAEVPGVATLAPASAN